MLLDTDADSLMNYDVSGKKIPGVLLPLIAHSWLPAAPVVARSSRRSALRRQRF